MTVRVINNCSDQGLCAGIIAAHDVVIQESPPELRRLIEELLEERKHIDFPPPEVKEAVRNMLRTKEYKPTGRGKPASEYLCQAAREGRFPYINSVVDINNYLSLLSALPISLLDAAVLGDSVEIRRGKPGEKYIFNASAQEIDLNGLACVCSLRGAESVALGNAVKDSIQGKVSASTKGVFAVIYCPNIPAIVSVLPRYLDRFRSLLIEFAGASSTNIEVIH